MTRRVRAAIAVIFVVQAFALVAVGAGHLLQLGADGIAHLRLAGYVLAGEGRLLVVGGRGPLLALLMTPSLALTDDPFLAARIAMGASAVVFVAGGVAVLRGLRLPEWVVVTGCGVLAVMSVRFSVFGITPDLLMSGLVCGAAAVIVGPAWTRGWLGAAVAGALFGLAFLAKPVALPIGALMVAATVALRIVTRGDARGVIGRAVLVTSTAFAVTAAPWLLAVTLVRGPAALMTPARLAHALVGPESARRGPAIDRVFRAPETGRLTTWEDPAVSPAETWSPVAPGGIRHQLRVVAANASLLWRYLGALDVLRLGGLALAIGVLWHRPWRRNMAEQPWRWSGALAACVLVVYLPVYAAAPRLYFTVIPFAFAAAAGLAIALTDARHGRRALARVIAAWAVTLSFGLPHAIKAGRALGATTPAPPGLELARRLARLEGGDSGDGPVAADGRHGLTVAYFLDRPYLGGVAAASADALEHTGAGLLVVRRTAPSVLGLRASAAFEDLDRTLFASPAEAESFPLIVFRARAVVPHGLSARAR